MKNENTPDAICVCGHTRIDHTSLKFADELVPCWVCSCKSFTTATSGEGGVDKVEVETVRLGRQGF